MPRIMPYNARLSGGDGLSHRYYVTDRYGRMLGSGLLPGGGRPDGMLAFEVYPPSGQRAKLYEMTRRGRLYRGDFIIPDPPPFSRFRKGPILFTVNVSRLLPRSRVARRYRRRGPARGYRRRALPRGARRFRGFGQEEIVEEIIEEPGPAPATGLSTVIAVGAIGFLGLGLFYGLTKTSRSGARRYRWAV